MENNTLKNNTPELLAPAGNMECLKAAVAMGANAVYLSGKEFGARHYAANFDYDELTEAVRYCHKRNVKVHVTVNTIVGDKEMKKLSDYLLFLDEIGVDALIIQDLGVLSLAQSLGLSADFHASTQMTVHNLSGAVAAKELGFDRVVLSRELSQKEIKYISENCGIETEIFIHGAMCMSYSGQCLMSSMLGGRSGNRGRCAQPCRQLYKSADGSEKFVLSLKDMSLLNKAENILSCGASSLKIEGRMKGSAYVACVVKTYADCLRENRKPTKTELDNINRIFYRGGQSSGYFDGDIGTQMFAFQKPDNPYKSGSEEIASDVLSLAQKRADSFKIKLSANIDITVGEKMKLTVTTEDGRFSKTVESESLVAMAATRPVSEDAVAKQLSKTGGSDFVFKNIKINIKDKNAYVSVKELNELRRHALSIIEQEILSAAMPKNRKSKKADEICVCENDIKPQKANSRFSASVLNKSQYDALIEFEKENAQKFDFFFVPLSVISHAADDFSEDKHRVVISLPAVIHDSELKKYEPVLLSLKDKGYENIRIHNVSGFCIGRGFNIFLSHRMNVSNSLAYQKCENIAASIMPSLEISIPQIRDIAKNKTMSMLEVLGYGHIPIMTTENCIVKNIDKAVCPCDKKERYLKDRLGTSFPIVHDGDSCRSVLLNSYPTFMADKVSELKSAGVDLIHLSFTIEKPEEIKRVCAAFFGLNKYRPENFTRMHYLKGII